MGQQPSKGVGRALAQERLRAEISVKLHMAIGDKAAYRDVLEQAFTASDADGDGTIDFPEFCSTASAIGIGVSETELRAAFARFDRDGNSTIDFHEVIDFMCPKVRSQSDAQKAAHVEYLTRMVENLESLEADSTDEGVSSAVQRVAEVVYDKEINIRSAFRTWDSDGSGKLDISEFVSAMNSLGFSMDLADARRVFKAFDVDGDGKLACWEFVRTLAQFDPDGNADGVVAGHNTGRGGGGDARKLPTPAADSNRGGGGGGGGGGVSTATAKRMQQKSRDQAERERAQKEAALAEAQAAVPRPRPRTQPEA